ncbi:MAG: ankyrin repeat domain-containing protein [Waddliaceae bacterium]
MPIIPNDGKSHAYNPVNSTDLDEVRSSRQWQGREIVLLPEDERRIDINNYLSECSRVLSENPDLPCITVVRNDRQDRVPVNKVEELAKALFENRNLIFEVIQDERKDLLDLLLLLKGKEGQFVEDILSSKQEENGYSPVHLAVISGHADLLPVLHQLGANFEERDRDGNTPAHIAAERGHVEVLRALSALDPNFSLQVTNNGFTPMGLAALNGKEDILDFAKELDPPVDFNATNEQGGCTLAHLAAQNGREEFLRRMKELQPDTDFRAENEYGQTAAHLATNKGHTGVLGTLKELDDGIDLQHKTRDGDTPAHWAADGGNVEVLRALCALDPNFSLQVTNNDGFTPMGLAALNGKEDILDFAKELDPPVDFNAKSEQGGSTLAHLAAQNGDERFLRRMKELQGDTDFRAENEYGQTALHLAVGDGNVGVLRTLKGLDAGIDLQHKDRDGDTPAHVAAASGHVEILRFFKEEGVDFLQQNQQGETVLDILFDQYLLPLGYDLRIQTSIYSLYLLLNSDEQKAYVNKYQENFQQMMAPDDNPWGEEPIVIEVPRGRQDDQQDRYFRKLLEVQNHLRLRRMQIQFQEDPQGQDVGGPSREFLTAMQNENAFKEYFCDPEEGIFVVDENSGVVVGFKQPLTPKRLEKMRLFTDILDQMYLLDLPLASIKFSHSLLRTLAPAASNLQLYNLNDIRDLDRYDVATLEFLYAYAKYDPYDSNLKKFYQDNGEVNREWIRLGLGFDNEDEYIKDLKEELINHANPLKGEKQFVLDLAPTKFGGKFKQADENLLGVVSPKTRQESAETIFISQIAPPQDLAKIFLTDEGELTNRLEFTISPHAPAESAPSPEQIAEVKQAFKSYLLSIKDDEQKLKDFVEAFTGSPLLSERKNLQIIVQQEILGEKPIFIHTCFHNADFSYQAFKDAQERGLSAQEYLALLMAGATGYRD